MCSIVYMYVHIIHHNAHIHVYKPFPTLTTAYMYKCAVSGRVSLIFVLEYTILYNMHVN